MADTPGGLAMAAGAGNSSLAGAFEDLLRSNLTNRPTSEQRQGALSAYTEAVKAPEDDRNEWQVLMAGRLAAENPANPFQAANAALKYKLMWDQTQREAVKKSNELAAKLQYEDIVARQKEAMGGAGMATQLAHAALNPIQNIGGVGVDRQTGRVIVPKDYIPIHSKIREDAYKAAVEQKMPNPEEYADRQADAYIVKVLQNASTSGPGYAQRPGQVPLPAQGGPATVGDNVVQTPQGPELSDPTRGGLSFDVSALSPEDRAQVQRLIARYRANPNPGTQEATARAINDLLNSGSLKQIEPLAYRDVPKAEMEKSTAEVTGKELGKEHASLNSAMDASNRMITQLDLLEQLYATPNMPEGELGPMIQQLRSGLKSLGVEVGKEVGAADIARAVASNFAMHLRTGEGTNLLPGAMSNYEDKLLQQMAPGLSLTAEGRAKLVIFMKEMAKSNVRMGHEANLLADKNRGVLPSDWRTRKERVMKEEMARLAEISRELSNKFQGAK